MKRISIFSILFIGLLFFGCRSESTLESEESDDTSETTETTGGVTVDTPLWTADTHGELAEPNYNAVFKQNEVIRIDLKIDASAWAAMLADVKKNLGSSSGRPGTLTEFDPIWENCSVYYNNIEWYKVGVRFKGNSSLSTTYNSGLLKYSLKLDFDQYEDDYPAIKNQRFYGFKQLNLKNNCEDDSFVREKVGADLFREFGLASSLVSFCEVYVDYGLGSKYFGLYSLVEEVDDTVLDSQYDDGSGNLYKPDGTAASFASGSYNTSQFYKQNNEDENDYSDVAALYAAINSSTRTSAPTEWQASLEKVFDVDIFLKWLAANTVIQNWDTYGKMTHNYFLYNNPASGKLNWIPWDNNEAFESGKGALSLGMTEVSSSWPLIRYILNTTAYKQKYNTYMKQFADEIFTVDKMTTLYSSYYTLLKEYAYNEVSGYSFLSSDAAFDSAINTLKTHVSSRQSAVTSYLTTGN